MVNCEQTKGLNVLQHGHKVNEKYKELYDFVVNGVQLKSEWCLPNWISEPIVRDLMLSFDNSIVETYQIYHDCGKPLCATNDEKGKHFFDHAAKSKQRWIEECCTGNEWSLTVGELIGMDMHAHILRGKEAREFTEHKLAPILIITALCEIHANAEMFGGLDSTSFKIKFDHLRRLGLRMIAFIAQR